MPSVSLVNTDILFTPHHSLILNASLNFLSFAVSWEWHEYSNLQHNLLGSCVECDILIYPSLNEKNKVVDNIYKTNLLYLLLLLLFLEEEGRCRSLI